MLAAGTRYRFALVKGKSGKDQPWVQINGANLVLQNLALAPRGGGAPVLELADARIGNANLDLYARKLDVAEVSLKSARLAAMRDIDGTLDWQKLFAVAGGAPPPAANPHAKPAAEAGVPWKLAVRSIRAQDWSARYTDNGYVQPVRVEAAGFGLAAALAGEVGSKTAIRVGPVNASLGPVKVFSGVENVVELGNISLVNANYEVAANELAIEALELSEFKTAVVLGKDKQLNWSRIMARHQATTKGYAVAAVTEKQAVKVKLGRLALNGVQLAVSDQSTPRPVKLDIVNGRARLNYLSLDYDKPITLEAGLDVRQGGKLSVSGSLVPGKPSGKLNLKLAGLSLKPFAPYVSRFARLDLQSGAASTGGKLDFARGAKGRHCQSARQHAVPAIRARVVSHPSAHSCPQRATEALLGYLARRPGHLRESPAQSRRPRVRHNAVCRMCPR